MEQEKSGSLVTCIDLLINNLQFSGTKDNSLCALGVGMTRLTAKALMYLVLVPANSTLPLHTPLRRAAIDLIGRGFTLWEPHLEVSKVLLGLLDMSSEAAMWVPSQKYGLPLTPGSRFLPLYFLYFHHYTRDKYKVKFSVVSQDLRQYLITSRCFT